MRYLTLDQIKKHLYIDFTADDAILAGYITAAEDTVENYINQKLSDLEDENGVLPAALITGMLIMAGNLYNNRESVAFNAVPHRIPYTLEYLIQPYKKYRREATDESSESE